jgi:hypothetical protein
VDKEFNEDQQFSDTSFSIRNKLAQVVKLLTKKLYDFENLIALTFHQEQHDSHNEFLEEFAALIFRVDISLPWRWRQKVYSCINEAGNHLGNLDVDGRLISLRKWCDRLDWICVDKDRACGSLI